MKWAVVALAALAAGMASPQGASAEATGSPPDLEGTWARATTHDMSDFLLGADLPYKPATQTIVADHLQRFKDGHSVASAHLTCRPTGVQGVTATKGAMLIL